MVSSAVPATLFYMWWQGEIAALDLETTSSDPLEARIVSAVCVVSKPDEPDHGRSWLVDPGVEIPTDAFKVHGISTERARREGMPAALAVQQITAMLAGAVLDGAPIAAFCARYDLTVLDRECNRHGVLPWWGPVGERLLVVDPFVIDKRIDRFRKGSRKLEAVCEHYGVELTDAHDAVADAAAAGRLARKLGSWSSTVGKASLERLHAMQVAWAFEQAESLEDWFERIGKPQRCERAWPLVPVRELVAA